MSMTRIVSALLATFTLTCALPSAVGAADSVGDTTHSAYFLRLFAFDDPGPDWKWDKRASRMFNQILLMKKGKGGSRLPQFIFREVEADSAFETPSALRAYFDAFRDRPTGRGNEVHEVLAFEFQPDTCFGGMSAWISQRTLVKDAKTGQPRRIEVVKRYVVRHPLERNLMGQVQYLWFLSPGEEPIAASENEAASLREGISLRTAVAESRYTRCLGGDR